MRMPSRTPSVWLQSLPVARSMPVSKVNSSGGQPEKLVTNRRIGHLILQMRVGRFSLLFLLAAISVFAQKYNPATWSLRLDPTAARPGSKVLARLDAKIEPGWHLYS